jgi:hypothetical protein
MITSNITKDIDIPDESTTMTIRMLSHGALKKARDTRLFELAKMVGGITFPTVPEGQREREVEQDPLAGYDVTTVLRKGIKSWSYDVPCNSANIDELDEVTAEFVAKAIIDLSRRTVVQGEVSGVE